jgi:hypothetical protein
VHRVGELIAIQGQDGQVYTGIVSSTSEQGCTVDVLADGAYRSLHD